MLVAAQRQNRSDEVAHEAKVLFKKKKKSRRLLKLIFYLVARGFVAIGVDSRCGELGDGTSRGKRIEREIKRDGKRGMAIDLLTILLLKDL